MLEVVNIKLKKDERLTYKDRKIYLTNRNLLINHKRIFKERIMLGDIREWRLEKSKIVIVIMKKGKLREHILEVSVDKVEEIFKELEESIKECKKIGYRKTTSLYWQDLVEGDYQLFNYSKLSLKIFGFFLTIFSIFIFFMGFLTLLKNSLRWEAWLALIFGYYITWSYPLYLTDKIIFTGDIVIHRYFFTLKYRRYSFKQLKERASDPWKIRYTAFDGPNSKSDILVKGSLLGTFIFIGIKKENYICFEKFMVFPHGYYGIYYKYVKEYEKVIKKIFIKEE